jgi:hypothetical protein
MTPEQVEKWEELLTIIISIEVGFIIIVMISAISMTPDPKVIEYFRNCNNLTLYPQGCQMLS